MLPLVLSEFGTVEKSSLFFFFFLTRVAKKFLITGVGSECRVQFSLDSFVHIVLMPLEEKA